MRDRRVKTNEKLTVQVVPNLVANSNRCINLPLEFFSQSIQVFSTVQLQLLRGSVVGGLVQQGFQPLLL